MLLLVALVVAVVDLVLVVVAADEVAVVDMVLMMDMVVDAAEEVAVVLGEVVIEEVAVGEAVMQLEETVMVHHNDMPIPMLKTHMVPLQLLLQGEVTMLPHQGMQAMGTAEVDMMLDMKLIEAMVHPGMMVTIEHHQLIVVMRILMLLLLVPQPLVPQQEIHMLPEMMVMVKVDMDVPNLNTIVTILEDMNSLLNMEANERQHPVEEAIVVVEVATGEHHGVVVIVVLLEVPHVEPLEVNKDINHTRLIITLLGKLNPKTIRTWENGIQLVSSKLTCKCSKTNQLSFPASPVTTYNETIKHLNETNKLWICGELHHGNNCK